MYLRKSHWKWRQGLLELWAFTALQSNTNPNSSLDPLGGAFILFPGKGLPLRLYLQLLDLLQQALQGRVLVTRVLLPDGVLETLQVGFRRLSLFKKLWRTGATPRQLKATEHAASPNTSTCRSIFPTSLSGRWLKAKMRAETSRCARLSER